MSFLVELGIRGTLLAAASLAAHRLLRGRSPARGHAVLLAGLAILVVLPLQVLMGPRWQPRRAEIITTPDAVPTVRALANLPLPSVLPSSGRASNESRSSSASRSADATARARLLLLLVMGIGVLACGAARVVGGWRVRRLLAGAHELPGGHPAVEAAHAAAAALGSRRRPRVVESSRCTVPFTAGTLRPHVVVPPGFGTWGDARVRAIMLHEVAHVRRYDVCARTVADAACAINWFNPLVWLSARRAVTEAELAADDLVVACGVDATAYAGALVGLARAFRGHRVLEPTLGVARSDLARRVERLTASRGGVQPVRAPQAVALLGLLALGGGLAAVDPRARTAQFTGSFATTMNVSNGGPEISTNGAGLQARWVVAGYHTGIFLSGQVDLADVLAGRLPRAPGAFVIAQETERGLATYAWPSDEAAPRWVREALRVAVRQLGDLEVRSSGAPRPPSDAGARRRLPGSTLVGTPARSDDPNDHVVQAGWVEGNRRYGVFLRGAWRTTNGRPETDDPRGWLDAFSYDPATGEVTRLTIVTRGATGRAEATMHRGTHPVTVDRAALAWVAALLDHVNSVDVR